MEDQVKKLEIEISYLCREIDSLKLLLNEKPNIINITYNMNAINEFPENMSNNMSDGFNLN